MIKEKNDGKECLQKKKNDEMYGWQKIETIITHGRPIIYTSDSDARLHTQSQTIHTSPHELLHTPPLTAKYYQKSLPTQMPTQLSRGHGRGIVPSPSWRNNCWEEKYLVNSKR
jgi:hypothetical protein